MEVVGTIESDDYRLRPAMFGQDHPRLLLVEMDLTRAHPAFLWGRAADGYGDVRDPGDTVS
jgi:hypothetical protein